MHCVRSFMPTHASSCVGTEHMSFGPVLGTHLFVATFAQSPWQSHLQHPTWLSRAMHSSGFSEQPTVLHCV